MLITLAQSVQVLPLRTPTILPATATNTMIVGRSRLLVIEPATPYEPERCQLIELLEQRRAQGAEIVAVALTHHHVDHIGFAQGLSERYAVPVWAHAQTASRVQIPIGRELSEGDVIELEPGVRIKVWFTPGHAPGHLVFGEVHTGIAYVGDMVAGVGTILIDPDDSGDMAAYLSSLRRLKGLGLRKLVPSHGPVIDDPAAMFDFYVQHRLGREAKIVAALSTEPRDFASVLARAYADKPAQVLPFAAVAMRAHLGKLEDEGRVLQRDGKICLRP